MRKWQERHYIIFLDTDPLEDGGSISFRIWHKPRPLDRNRRPLRAMAICNIKPKDHGDASIGFAYVLVSQSHQIFTSLRICDLDNDRGILGISVREGGVWWALEISFLDGTVPIQTDVWAYLWSDWICNPCNVVLTSNFLQLGPYFLNNKFCKYLVNRGWHREGEWRSMCRPVRPCSDIHC